jgi:hypothetical protein
MAMTKLSQLLQEKLSKAFLSFQTIMKQIGSEFHDTTVAGAGAGAGAVGEHTTEVSQDTCTLLT